MGHTTKKNKLISLLISECPPLYNKRKKIKERGLIYMPCTKILNKSECHFLTLTILGNVIFGTGLKSKKLDIDHVQILEDRTETVRGFFSSKVIWDADFMIYTKDGNKIHVRSTEEAFFRTIYKYL